MLAIECANPIPSVSLPASLYSNCGKLAVEIKSLANDRAMIVAGERPDCGSFAFLVRNGIKVPAVIAWRRGDVLGLSFETCLDDGRSEKAFRAWG
jgi:hypothetical protein